MRQVLAVVVALGVVVSASPRAQVVGQSWDATFRVMPKPDNIEATMKLLLARPHHVGSAYDKDNAEWILASSRRWGWDAQIETFDVLFPTPSERLVELVAPTRSRRSSRSRRSRGSDLGPEDRAAPDLQRLLHRRRRHGAARLRQLRPAGGLRRTRQPASPCRAPSSSRATAGRGAASSRRSRPSTARSAA